MGPFSVTGPKMALEPVGPGPQSLSGPPLFKNNTRRAQQGCGALAPEACAARAYTHFSKKQKAKKDLGPWPQNPFGPPGQEEKGGHGPRALLGPLLFFFRTFPEIRTFQRRKHAKTRDIPEIPEIPDILQPCLRKGRGGNQDLAHKAFSRDSNLPDMETRKNT